jgi:CheY-like chemotaxis protein
MKTVLIVDDDIRMLGLIKSILETEGYEATEAESAEVALLYYGRRGIDLIITDVEMPGMNGIELVKEIRRLDQKARIVVMSGSSSKAATGWKQKALEAGATRTLEKPITYDSLISLIKEIEAG